MLRRGDRIAVAVSGGKDSLSLLHILNNICKDHSTQLHAVMIDEGVAGYRDEAIGLTKAYAEELRVPLLVLSYADLFGTTLDDALDWKTERKTTSCSICGTLRRRAIDIGAKRINADIVATAHNMDDLLQTYLINLFNGDIERLKWLDPGHKGRSEFALRRIKPFSEIYEQELAFYAYLSGIPFQSESCPYMNEGIRTEMRSFINALESKHPGIKYSMLGSVVGTSQRLSGSDEKPLLRCESCGNPSSSETCSVCRTIQLIRINK